VGTIECRGDLAGVGQRPVDRQRAPLETGREGFAVDVLHYQEVHGAADGLGPTDVVQRADVGMIEGRNGARLALEALPSLPVGGHVRRQHLDGDRPVEPGIARLVDLPMPPAPAAATTS